MIKITRYENDQRTDWDEFVRNSKNGTFLFYRDYMEYHSDRFQDHSLLIFDEKETLIGLLPANIKEDTLYSHQGLTYGGIITNNRMTMPVMLDIFSELKQYLKANGVKKLRYKAMPNIYHKMPACEDLYALFINNAKLVRRDIASSIDRTAKVGFSSQRKRGLKRALKNGVEVKASDNYEEFMNILKERITSKYGTDPTHNLQEIEYLRSKFPDNIKLFLACKEDEVLAGSVVYVCPEVVHSQYIASTQPGREMGAVDIVCEYLINDYLPEKRYYDFGISTEQDGWYLNLGLINQKEGFGARGTVYDTYELEISTQ